METTHPHTHNSQGTKARGKNVRNVRLCLTRSPIKRGGYERGRFLTSELSSGLVTRELIECVPTGTHQVSRDPPWPTHTQTHTHTRIITPETNTHNSHMYTHTHNSQGTKARGKNVRNVCLCLTRSPIKRGGYERGRF